MGKRQLRTVGAIVRIELGNGNHSYARILDKAFFAFYDLKVNHEITDLEHIISRPILFIIAAYDDIITKGRWIKIGAITLEENLHTLPMQFIKDAIDPTKFRLHNPNTGDMISATKDDCKGLELAAVWEAEEIEERLNDHFEGRTNRLVEEDKNTFA
jgi:hypothetical protein